MIKNYRFDLPLEILLEKTCINSSDFPTQENYFERYKTICSHLYSNVYNNINTGLSACSENTGIYTDHGPDHFDQVVLHAGCLLKINSINDVENIKENLLRHQWILSPYELYVLLLSIRLHDVGNIYGRDEHEKNITKVIKEYNIPILSSDRLEARWIAEIAGAHGGISRSGSKDTIATLPEKQKRHSHVGKINQRKIAAITRFADEICENRTRGQSISPMNIPEKNLIFHKYALGIIANTIENNILHLVFEYKIGDLLCLYSFPTGEKNALLTEEIIKRLKKAELERRYCNRFLPDSIKIKEISVELEIRSDEIEEESYCEDVLRRISFTLKEEGYPESPDGLFSENTLNLLNCENLRKEFRGD